MASSLFVDAALCYVYPVMLPILVGFTANQWLPALLKILQNEPCYLTGLGILLSGLLELSWLNWPCITFPLVRSGGSELGGSAVVSRLPGL